MDEPRRDDPPAEPPAQATSPAEPGPAAPPELPVVPDGPQPRTVGELLALATPRAWVTPALAGLLVVTFALSVLAGVDPMSPTTEQLLRVGGSFGPQLLAGEWWRLLSPVLLHAGLLHLAFNLWALWSGGRSCEQIFGNAGYAAIFVLSGVGSSLLSVVMQPRVVSVGASGAIFGVYGALLTFALTHRGVFPPEWLARMRNSLGGFLFYNVIFALSAKGIDLWGHAGGFVTGMAAGWLLRRDILRPSALGWRRALGAAALALALAGCALGARARVAHLPGMQAAVVNDAIAAAFERGDFQGVVDRATGVLATTDEPWSRARLLGQRGAGLLALDRLEPAAADLREALRLREEAPTLALLCGAETDLAGDDREKLLAAVGTCDGALRRDAGSVHAHRARALLHLRLGEPLTAAVDAEWLLTRDPGDRIALEVRRRAGGAATP